MSLSSSLLAGSNVSVPQRAGDEGEVGQSGLGDLLCDEDVLWEEQGAAGEHVAVAEWRLALVDNTHTPGHAQVDRTIRLFTVLHQLAGCDGALTAETFDDVSVDWLFAHRVDPAYLEALRVAHAEWPHAAAHGARSGGA